jgi:hypothetical protein
MPAHVMFFVTFLLGTASSEQDVLLGKFKSVFDGQIFRELFSEDKNCSTSIFLH